MVEQQQQPVSGARSPWKPSTPWQDVSTAVVSPAAKFTTRERSQRASGKIDLDETAPIRQSPIASRDTSRDVSPIREPEVCFSPKILVYLAHFLCLMK